MRIVTEWLGIIYHNFQNVKYKGLRTKGGRVTSFLITSNDQHQKHAFFTIYLDCWDKSLNLRWWLVLMPETQYRFQWEEKRRLFGKELIDSNYEKETSFLIGIAIKKESVLNSWL